MSAQRLNGALADVAYRPPSRLRYRCCRKRTQLVVGDDLRAQLADLEGHDRRGLLGDQPPTLLLSHQIVELAADRLGQVGQLVVGEALEGHWRSRVRPCRSAARSIISTILGLASLRISGKGKSVGLTTPSSSR